MFVNDRKLALEEEALMPKMKTHKGTAKRMRLTKNGKVMRMKQGRNHLRRRRTSSQIRNYRHAVPSETPSIVKLVKRVAGNAAQSTNGKK